MLLERCPAKVNMLAVQPAVTYPQMGGLGLWHDAEWSALEPVSRCLSLNGAKVQLECYACSCSTLGVLAGRHRWLRTCQGDTRGLACSPADVLLGLYASRTPQPWTIVCSCGVVTHKHALGSGAPVPGPKRGLNCTCTIVQLHPWHGATSQPGSSVCFVSVALQLR